jgi:hypothetical protein
MDDIYHAFSTRYNIRVALLPLSAKNRPDVAKCEEIVAAAPPDLDFVFIHPLVPKEFAGQREYEQEMQEEWRFSGRLENTIHHFFSDGHPGQKDNDLEHFLQVITTKEPRYVIQCSGPDFPGILEAITGVLRKDYNITSLSLGVTPMLHSTYVTCVDARSQSENRFRNRMQLERQIADALGKRAHAYYEAKMMEAQKQDPPKVLIESNAPKPFTIQINISCPDSRGQIYQICQALKGPIPDTELRFFNVDEMTLIHHSTRNAEAGEVDLHVSCTSSFGRNRNLAESLLRHLVLGIFESIYKGRKMPGSLDWRLKDSNWLEVKKGDWLVRGRVNWFGPTKMSC